MTRPALTFTRPLFLLPGIAVAVLVAGMATLLMMPAPEAAAAVTAADPLPDVKPEGGRDRSCNACGFVETIRRSDPATGLTAYAFTVRMRDGSTRDSSQPTRGRWIEGDRVIVIGGAAARALEEEKSDAL